MFRTAAYNRGMTRFLLPALLLLPLTILQGCAPSGTDAATGERVFRQCASCHQVGANARGGFGPQLNGLFGRRAGATPDFAYSDAMKRSGIVWDERTLSAFLHDPGKLVPGTNMRFWGIGDDNEIAALLAYLRTFQQADQPATTGAPSAPH
jgi:cytochrome c